MITEWALDSYLNLKHKQFFTDHDYWTILRPDVERLRGGIPSSDPKFSGGLWGPAKVGAVALSNGYKMKWHNLGPSSVQLRLPVMAGGVRQAFLCEAYVKNSPAADRRHMAKFKTHMNLIALKRYDYRGSI